MANLLGSNIGTNYKSILNLDATTINTPLDATLRAVTDGMGTSSPLQLSTDQVGVIRTIALSVGATSPRLFNEVYTINNVGAQTGTLTGIFLNATETALNGMTHNLIDLQVGGVSKFIVKNSGNVCIGNGAFSADDSQILINRSLTTGGGATGFHALRDETLYSTNDVLGLRAYASFDAIPVMQGTATFNHLHSFQSRPNYSGTGTIDALRGFSHQATNNGAIDLHQAVYINDYLGTGTANQNVGLYIKPLVKGVSNFAIFTEGTTPSFLGGNVQSNGIFRGAGVIIDGFGTNYGSIPSFDVLGNILDNPNLTIINGVLDLKSITEARVKASATNLDLDAFFNVRFFTSSNTGSEKGRFSYNGNLLINTTTDNGGKLQIKAPGALSTDIALRVRNSADSADLMLVNGLGNVGIGTSEPQRTLDSYTLGGAFRGNNYVRLGVGAAGAYGGNNHLEFSYNDYGNISGGRTADNIVAKIQANTDVVSPTDVGGILMFLTKDKGGTYLTAPVERMRITSIGKIGIGTSAPTALLHIKGSGLTSATTSLLVQNSVGTDALTVKDDLSVTASNNLYVGNSSLTYSGYNLIAIGGSATGATLDFIHNGVRTGEFYTDALNFNFFTDTGKTLNFYVNNSFARPAITAATNSNIGINVVTPATSAQLDVSSTTKGFLPPRMTTTQKNAIASPANGLVVFDTTLNKLAVFTTVWEAVTSS